MTERDYLHATNLAKLRIAYDVLRGVQYSDGADHDAWQELLHGILKLTRKLEKWQEKPQKAVPDDDE